MQYAGSARRSAAALAVSLTVVLGGFTPATAHPPTIVNAATEKAMAEEVGDFRKRMARAIEAKDTTLLRKLYADSFRHTHEDGNLHAKDARIAAALAGEAVIEAGPVEDLKISVPNGWAAIVTGRSPSRGRDGTAYRIVWTAVYVRAGDSWQLAATQATRLAVP